MAPHDKIDESLLSLISKEAIREKLYQYCRAIDRNDKELLRDCYHPDAMDYHGIFEGQASEFVNLDADTVMPGLKVLQHSISNILIELDGHIARVESYVFAYHSIETEDGSHDLLVGGRYLDRFELREGAWRIAVRRCVFDWARYDRATVDWSNGMFAGLRPRGRRDRSDPLYGL